MKCGIRYKYTDMATIYEDELRGYCYCILVLINNKKYKMSAYDIRTVAGRFRTRDENYNYFCFSYNMIIVEKVVRSEIKRTIKGLSTTDFFEKLGGKIEVSNYDVKNDKDVSENELKIIYQNKSDEYYSATLRNGYRDDIVVKINKKSFHLNVMTIDRILLDYGYEIRTKGYYVTKPNLVIVKMMDRTNIEKAINGLNEEGFFSRLGALDENANWGVFEYMHKK